MKAKRFGWAFAALLLVLWAGRLSAAECGGQGQQAQPGARGQDHAPDGNGPRKWWTDPQDRATLGITDQQSTAVEALWQKSLPDLRSGWQQLHTMEDALNEMIRNSADEQAVIAQIDRVEDMRAKVEKGRQLMLYRMNRVLTPEQRDRLKALHDHREPPHRSPAPR
ncbi:MAG: Spy/CpxP family protein refolding chaperone [Vicinamibacterales bacterium]